MGVADSLISKGADINKKEETPLFYAIRNKDNEIVDLLVSKGADVNARDRNDQTPLLCAIQNNNKDAIKILIRYMLENVHKCKEYHNLIHIIYTYCDLEFAKECISKNIDLDAYDANGSTALITILLLNTDKQRGKPHK